MHDYFKETNFSSSGGTSFKLLQSQPQFDVTNNLWPA